jgi:very-short-patch-repair endonuclease
MNAVATLRTESPIEALLLRAIGEEIERCRLDCSPTTQAKIGPYRVDILVEMDGRKLVVECDGAEFHAKNKDQVERDKRRDRFFAAHGISVMRFTGSEISRSPRACAAEVGSWLETTSAARKAAIMAKWERGEISRLQACRAIRRGGLVSA